MCIIVCISKYEIVIQSSTFDGHKEGEYVNFAFFSFLFQFLLLVCFFWTEFNISIARFLLVVVEIVFKKLHSFTLYLSVHLFK